MLDGNDADLGLPTITFWKKGKREGRTKGVLAIGASSVDSLYKALFL